MTTFDDREKAFEKKFAHDEELKFKINAKRNKLLGLWAAGLLGMAGAEADSYAKEVVMSEYEEAGDHDVLRKVHKDLSNKGVTLTQNELRVRMDVLLDAARQELMAG